MKKIIGFRAIFDAIFKGSLVSMKIDPAKRNHVKVKELLEMELSNVTIEWEPTNNVIEGFIDVAITSKNDIFKQLEEKEKSLVLVLDQLQDTGNFGAIIRSADAFGVDLIVIPNRNSVKVTDTVIKISTGSTSNLEILEVSNLLTVINKLKELKYWIYGSDATGTKNYKGAFSKKSCIVMGNESTGMRKTIKESCDELVSIPIRIDSLNVSHACTILLCEAYNSVIK